MKISASDYTQLGFMLISIATTLIIPFINRPMLSVDYSDYEESGYINRNITVANNGITPLHNVKGSIIIPHAASSIEIIPDKYMPWSFAIMKKYENEIARASFNMTILPPQVAVNLNVKAALANGAIVRPLTSVFSDEWDGNPQLYIWGINAAVSIIVMIFSYMFYRILDKTLRRHMPPAA